MLVFTSSAAAKIASLALLEPDPNVSLRVYVEGGGCSGFRYGFKFEETMLEDDVVIETDGVKLLVDPISLQYLDEAEIDYVDSGLAGSEFIIRNPNAKSTCGCGSSFNA